MENSSRILYLKYLLSWLVFLTIVFPILFPIFLIVLIFRLFVDILAKLFHPDLIKRLNSTEYLFSIDKFYKRPFSNNILLIFTKGELSSEEVQHEFGKSVLGLEKLVQYPKEFCSYYFWKKVEFFDIKNYTREVCVKNESDLDLFLSTWIMQPFGKGKSPWEIAVIRIVENECSAVAMKIHSTITCNYGFSTILEIITENVEQKREKVKKFSTLNKVNLLLKFPYTLFQIYLQEILNHEDEDSSQNRCNCEIVCARTEIPTARLNAITRRDVNSVSNSLVGALRKLHGEKKIRNFNNNSPERTISPEHASDPLISKICNQCSRSRSSQNFSFDPIQRLLDVQNEPKEEKDMEIINQKQVPILSILPKRILRAIFGVPGATVIRHNFMPSTGVGGEKTIFIWGRPIASICSIYGMSRPNLGVTITSTHNINTTGYTILANKHVIPDQEAANRIMKYFKDQDNELPTYYS